MESRSDDGNWTDAFAYWVHDNCYIFGIADGQEEVAVTTFERFAADDRLNFRRRDAERLTDMVIDEMRRRIWLRCAMSAKLLLRD